MSTPDELLNQFARPDDKRPQTHDASWDRQVAKKVLARLRLNKQVFEDCLSDHDSPKSHCAALTIAFPDLPCDFVARLITGVHQVNPEPANLGSTVLFKAWQEELDLLDGSSYNPERLVLVYPRSNFVPGQRVFHRIDHQRITMAQTRLTYKNNIYICESFHGFLDWLYSKFAKENAE
jgi:hypothetical protein